jgi:hypothetical protein
VKVIVLLVNVFGSQHVLFVCLCLPLSDRTSNCLRHTGKHVKHHAHNQYLTTLADFSALEQVTEVKSCPTLTRLSSVSKNNTIDKVAAKENTLTMSHPQDIPMPDYDHAYAMFQAELAGGDTDDGMSEAPSPLPASPPMPLYNGNPPHCFDIPPSHTIDLTNELTRPGGPLPISGPYFNVDISKTLKLMLEAYRLKGQRFFRLKFAINYLSQGFSPACKYPGCTSRCRIVDHDLKVLTWKKLQSGGEDHLKYVVTDKEHPAFLSVSCNHDDWTPSFMWKIRVVGFMANPVVETKTYERWATPEFFFHRQRDADNFPGMVSGPILSRRERREQRRTSI